MNKYYVRYYYLYMNVIYKMGKVGMIYVMVLITHLLGIIILCLYHTLDGDITFRNAYLLFPC